jgi:hypothetical protein
MGNANDADMNAAYGKQFERVAKNTLTTSTAKPKNPLLKLPPDNRLRTPPVTPWAIPAFIGCINPAVKDKMLMPKHWK